MYFLVDYDRRKGEIVSLRTFDELRRNEAEEARLALELELRHGQGEHEVVILEASDEAALRKTHRRYFESIDSLVKSDL